MKSNNDLMQQAILTILSVSQNTEIFTKMRENESHIDFRQQLNAVQNNLIRSSLNGSSALTGVKSEVENLLYGHEKIKNKDFVNFSNDTARRKNTESKDNLSSFLSETNFSKEDLMDIFAKAIAGASKSTSITASYAKGSASTKTNIVRSRKMVLQDSGDSSDQSDSASDGSVRSASCSASSDESEYDDMDVGTQVRENLSSEKQRSTPRSSNGHSPSSRIHSSNSIIRASSKNAKIIPTILISSDREPTPNSRVSSRRDLSSVGGPVKRIPEPEYTSRQARPVVDEGLPYKHDTEREVCFEGKNRRAVKDEVEDYKIGVNYKKENAIALQAARDISGIYVSPQYQDYIYQQAEGTTASPELHYYLLSPIML